MRTKKRLLSWLAIVFLAGLGGVSIARYFPKQQNLLAISQKVMPTGFNREKGLMVLIGWISDHEILGCYLPGHVGFLTYYFVFDTHTGADRGLYSLRRGQDEKYGWPLRLSSDC